MVESVLINEYEVSRSRIQHHAVGEIRIQESTTQPTELTV